MLLSEISAYLLIPYMASIYGIFLSQDGLKASRIHFLCITIT